MSTVKKFQRRKEDFVCENCDQYVEGSGYTNHCPKCLHSKHVDIFPGDRLEDCGGLITVVEITRKGDGYVLTHKCTKCGSQQSDRFRENYNVDALIKLSEKLSQL